jgi:hypothetical protein
MQRKNTIKEKILIGFFLVAVFVNFLGPIIDIDFPLHLKTGEYIYQHREIPKDDPFSFYGEGIVTDREKFTLSQYWLAQIIFYKLYSIAGPTGVILLRATVFSAFVFLLWFALRKRGLYSSLIIAILVAIIFQLCKLDRPQFFSFLFTLILILLLERFRENPDSAMPLYFVPPLMLLWANMHAGFVVGIAVILIYTLSEALKFFINKPNLIGQPFGKKPALMFFVIALLAILFSYVNPIMNGSIIAALESHTTARWLYETIREYMSPLEEMGSPFVLRVPSVSFWVLFGFISIIVTLNTLRTKSIDITIFALILSFSVAAFTAVRYIPFYLAVALPLSKGYKFFRGRDFLRDLKLAQITFVLFLILFVLAIGYGLKDGNNIFKIGRQNYYPEGVADFLLNNRIEANMFNQNNRGSYLMWKLYPYYKVFNDSRFISLEAVDDSNVISYSLENYTQSSKLGLANALSAMVPKELGRINVSSPGLPNSSDNKPLWKRLVEQYKIDLIVHEATADFSGTLYPLTLRLLKDDDWVLIYVDGTMQIFVRNMGKYSKMIERFRKPKELIYDEIILETIPSVRKKITVSAPYSSLAFALMMKGKEEDAKKMIDAALALDRNDLVANFCISYLVLKQKAQENLKHSRE